MNIVRAAAPHLEDMVAYDPQYLPAKAFLSANENARDISESLRDMIAEKVALTPFNRYPDPLANDLRDQIACAYGLERDQVLVGNGGDELLFNLVLAWGGPGRKLLNVPPTFSVYTHNATLTGTEVVNVRRREDLTIDEEAVLERVSQGDIDCIVIASPNNPSGDLVDQRFIRRLLSETDALVLVDEAYYEFADVSTLPLLSEHKNLVILHTFSKAYRLAAVRLGYVLAHVDVVKELIKVRQPYSVDRVSQVIGSCVFERRAEFVQEIDEIIERRESLYASLIRLNRVQVYPSDANYLLIKVEGAHEIWEKLYERGVLVRDFSSTPGLENCLRVSVGSPEENALFLKEFTTIVQGDLI